MYYKLIYLVEQFKYKLNKYILPSYYYKYNCKTQKLIILLLKMLIPYCFNIKDSIIIEETINNNIKLYSKPLDNIIPNNAIVDILITSDNNYSRKLFFLKSNIYSIDKNIPLNFILKNYENINIFDNMEIKIIYSSYCVKKKINNYLLIKYIF